MLDRVERRKLMVLEHDLALRVNGEADVEEAVRKGFMPRLGLGHDEHVPVTCEVAQEPRLGRECRSPSRERM